MDDPVSHFFVNSQACGLRWCLFCRWRWCWRSSRSGGRWCWCRCRCRISLSSLPVRPLITGTSPILPQHPIHILFRIRHGLALCPRLRLPFLLLHRHRHRRRRRLRFPPLLPALLQQRPPRALHRQVRVRRVVLGRLPHVVVHAHDHRQLAVHVQLALGLRQFALLLLDVLPALAQPDPVLPQPRRQRLPLEVRQDARDHGVEAAEDGDQDVRGRRGAERGEGGGDDDLQEVAGVDERGDGVELPARGALFGDDAGVDAEVGGGAFRGGFAVGSAGVIAAAGAGGGRGEVGGVGDAEDVAEFLELRGDAGRRVEVGVGVVVEGDVR